MGSVWVALATDCPGCRALAGLAWEATEIARECLESPRWRWPVGGVTLDTLERWAIREALKATPTRVAASKQLGISERTMHYKLHHVHPDLLLGG